MNRKYLFLSYCGSITLLSLQQLLASLVVHLSDFYVFLELAFLFCQIISVAVLILLFLTDEQKDVRKTVIYAGVLLSTLYFVYSKGLFNFKNTVFNEFKSEVLSEISMADQEIMFDAYVEWVKMGAKGRGPRFESLVKLSNGKAIAYTFSAEGEALVNILAYWKREGIQYAGVQFGDASEEFGSAFSIRRSEMIREGMRIMFLQKP